LHSFNRLFKINYFIVARIFFLSFSGKRGSGRQSKEIISLHAPSDLLSGKSIDITNCNVSEFSCSG